MIVTDVLGPPQPFFLIAVKMYACFNKLLSWEFQECFRPVVCSLVLLRAIVDYMLLLNFISVLYTRVLCGGEGNLLGRNAQN